ncbi:hypothetical protein Cni_G27540 [Canna indica]|uniref:DUF7792 domain-containing protein n=1 Tax=Canna indica TaxID=4628 RepID=A0AAQ3L546_9LILI|nr:hypothetical protein Cni_G27540 [Canna indica]
MPTSTKTKIAIAGSGGAGEELSLSISLADCLKEAAAASHSFRGECSQLAHRADLLASSLRAVVRCLASLPHQPPYVPPVRRVAAAAARSLDRALSLARRCRRSQRRLLSNPFAILRLLFPFAAPRAAEFRRVLSVLDASLADLRWLLSLYSSEDDGAASGGAGLPPIATSDPVLSYVWTCVVAVEIAPRASDRAEAAQSLANLALDGHRNRWVIVDEGGVPPLLALLQNGDDEASQSAAAAALANLSFDRELVLAVADALAIPTIVHTLSKSTSTRLQMQLAILVSRMAAADATVREEFATENATLQLVALLSAGVPLANANHALPTRNNSLRNESSCLFLGNGGSDIDERENEISTAKLELKTACAEALWVLCKDSIANSRKVAETIGLLCLAKLIETEKEQLQFNCLMTVAEIAAAAESDADLRSSAFKNSPAAAQVVKQLLELVRQQGTRPSLQMAAIRSIGSLARIFPAKEVSVLQPLVAQLSHWDADVCAEAATALGKFAGPENFLCVEHSTAIVEFDGVPPLMRLLRPGKKSQLPGLVLLCYLSLHAPGHEALERAKVLLALKSVDRSVAAHCSSLNKLIPKAIQQLELHHPETHAWVEMHL